MRSWWIDKHVVLHEPWSSMPDVCGKGVGVREGAEPCCCPLADLVEVHGEQLCVGVEGVGW